MNDKKFLFVSCVKHENIYNLALQYINSLVVPLGYTIEIMPIYNAVSMTSGYNQALSNDAKYKIYLHEDVLIRNIYFLHNILEIFRNCPTLGLLGVAGSTTVPPTGVWWNGNRLVGKIFEMIDGTTRLRNFNEIHYLFETVSLIDGVLMATQYDIPWRQDLFTGFHYYDLSQCMEFIKNGYTVGVAKQLEPWCIHYYEGKTGDPSSGAMFEHNRQIFMDNYMRPSLS